MTIQATRGRELPIDTIVRRAYQIAGLMPAEQGTSGPTWEGRAALGRDLLTVILDGIQGSGIFARNVVFENLTLVSGTFQYSLSSNVFDVVEDGAYIAPGQSLTLASGETPVVQKDRETWQRMSSKGATGRPVMFFADRSVFPIQVRLWPVPSEAGTIRFQAHRLVADTTDGNATVDLERHWMEFLHWKLAAMLASASSLPNEKVMMLDGFAERAKTKAESMSHQHVPNQFHLVHRAGAYR